MSTEDSAPTGAVTSDDIAATANALAGADSSPAPTSDEATSAPSTTATDSSDDVSTSPGDDAGPIPLERHKAVLENARRKAREEAEQELRSKLGWAERYQPENVAHATQLLDWVQRDPQGVMRFLQSQIPAEPAPAAPDDPPPPDLRAEDGTLVYSAPQSQKLLEYYHQRWQRQIAQEYGPIKDRVERAEMTARASEQASSLLTTARTQWPRFGELEADIRTRMVADGALSLHDAYIAAFREHGMAALEEEWRAKYTGQVATKASAGTVKPGSAPVKPRKYSEMDLRELVEAEFKAASRP